MRLYRLYIGRNIGSRPNAVSRRMAERALEANGVEGWTISEGFAWTTRWGRERAWIVDLFLTTGEAFEAYTKIGGVARELKQEEITWISHENEVTFVSAI